MRTTTWLIDWASCWTAPGVAPEGGMVELPEDIPLPASSAIKTARPADSRRYRMALPLFHWAGYGANHRAGRLCQEVRLTGPLGALSRDTGGGRCTRKEVMA